MSKNKRNKRKPPELQNQLPSLSPIPSSQQLEKLRLLVDERLNNERVNNGELVTKLSAEFQSTDDFIKHNMLLMLATEEVYIAERGLNRRRIDKEFIQVLLEDGRIEHLVANNELTTSLLTYIKLIETLLADEQLIEAVFEYILDPIKLNRNLMHDKSLASSSDKYSF